MSFSFCHIVPAPHAGAPAVGAADRGLLLGDGVFDTMVSFGGVIFARDRHLDRLERHAGLLGIAADRSAIEAAIDAILAETKNQHAIIRTTLTRGEAARGLWPAATSQPTVIVSAQPWSPALIGQPARLIRASVPRNECSPLSRIKSLAYLDNILAAREAAAASVDDALISNLEGNAVCSTIANVFALTGATLRTPPVADGCLDGVMRALVLEEAQLLGLTPREESLTSSLLAQADALFLTNSVRVIRPATALDERDFTASPIIPQLLRRLLDRIARETGARLDSASSLP